MREEIVETENNLAITLSRCAENGALFGIRFEKTDDAWTFTWAFPISQQSAKKEGYGRKRIAGSFRMGPSSTRENTK